MAKLFVSLLSILMAVSANDLLGQKGDYWSFAYGNGIYFTDGSVQLVRDSGADRRSHASICDDDGNLVLYADVKGIYSEKNEKVIGSSNLKNAERFNVQSFFVKQNDDLYYYVYSGKFYELNGYADIRLYYSVLAKESGVWVLKKSDILLDSNLPVLYENSSWPEFKLTDNNSVLMLFRSKPVTERFPSDTIWVCEIITRLSDSALVLEVKSKNYQPEANNFKGSWATYVSLSRISPNSAYFTEVCFVSYGNQPGAKAPFRLIIFYRLNQKDFKLERINSLVFVNNTYWTTRIGEFGNTSDNFYLFQGDTLFKFSGFDDSNVFLSKTFTNINPYQISMTDAKLAPDGNIYLSGHSKEPDKDSGYSKLIQFKLPEETFDYAWYKSKEMVSINFNQFMLPINLYSNYFVRGKLEQKKCGDSVALINNSDKIFTHYKWVFPDGRSIETVNRDTVIYWGYSGVSHVKLYGWNNKSEAASDQIIFDYASKPVLNFAFIEEKGCEDVFFYILNKSQLNSYAFGDRKWWVDFGDGVTQGFNALSEDTMGHLFTDVGEYDLSIKLESGSCAYFWNSPLKIDVLSSANPEVKLLNQDECEGGIFSLKNVHMEPVDSIYHFVGNTKYVYSEHQASYTYDLEKHGQLLFREYLLAPTGCLTGDSLLIDVKEGLHPNQAFKAYYATIEGGSIQLHWDKIDGASAYLIHTNDKSSGNWPVVQLTDTFYTVQTEKNPEFEIIAKDSCGKTISSSGFSPIYLKSSFTPYTGVANLDWNETSLNVVGFQVEVIRDLAFYSFSSDNLKWNEVVSDEDISKIMVYRIKGSYWYGNNQIAIYSNYDTLNVPFEVLVPNSFSPNGDNLNDTFEALCTGVNNFIFGKMEIWNTWGEQILSVSSSDISDLSWNGYYKNERVSSGVYIVTVQIKYKLDDGTYQIKNYKGNLTVIN